MLTGATRRHARRRAHEPFERMCVLWSCDSSCLWMVWRFPPTMSATRHSSYGGAARAASARSREDPCQPVAGGRAPTTRRVCGVGKTFDMFSNYNFCIELPDGFPRQSSNRKRLSNNAGWCWRGACMRSQTRESRQTRFRRHVRGQRSERGPSAQHAAPAVHGAWPWRAWGPPAHPRREDRMRCAHARCRHNVRLRGAPRTTA